MILDLGNERYYNFADIPFFWFRLTVMYNPEVVESWTFPGTGSSKTQPLGPAESGTVGELM